VASVNASGVETGHSGTSRGVEISEMEYRVLGPICALVDGRPLKLGGPRQRMVLAVLLSRANHTIPQDTLIDAVWAGEPPEAAKATVQGYIHALRRELGADQIIRDGAGYRIEVSENTYDALRFEHLVEIGRGMLQTRPAESAALLKQGLAMWFGTPYGGLESNPLLLSESSRLELLRLSAVESRVEAALAIGDHAGVVVELETLVRDHPFRERFRAQQMLALYRCGRQAEALRAFQRARIFLGDELGIEPSTELRELEQRILEQDPTLDFVQTADSHSMDGNAQGSPLGVGRMIRGYELREELGRGDYGVVYRAFQPSVGREVAVKVIRPEYANQPAFVERFEREAQIVAQLEHPHIVPLFDFWRDPDGAYLVMPHMRGGNLATLLRQGGWQLAPALRLVEHIGGALAHAHRRGVVHRDVKPANVLLDEDGNAYLSDFGIAARLLDDSDLPLTTSLAFIPPEEIRGEPHTARSDVFSLGILIFELLTGVVPAGRVPLASLGGAHPSVPDEMEQVLARATDDNPVNRYQRVEDLLRAFRLAIGADVVAIAETYDPEPKREPARNPYKGLRAFLETDAVDFYGRDTLVDELLQTLAQNNLVALIGPSGSGKSSVVRAGLIPALRAGGLPGSRHWLTTDMYPGTFPFEELEAALLRVAIDRPADLLTELLDRHGLIRVAKRILPGDESTLVLLIDQFEELFSSVPSEASRKLFLENLVEVAKDERSRIRVVLTMRADFFSRPLEYAEFAEVMADGLVTVPSPTRDSLAQAISAPARSVGVELEPGLVGQIVFDVEDQPGGLPLLQYALTELFSRRQGDALTLTGYAETGGVLGALGRRAEEIFRELTEAGKDAARQLFLRLVTVDDTATDTRRRARQSDLRSLEVDKEALDQVLSQFGTFRLLSFDRDPVTRGPTVEVAHEALLGEWARLRDWIDEEREGLILTRRLSIASQEWVESGQDPSFLLRGARLEQVEDWTGGTSIALTVDETEYLGASRARRDAEERATRQRRRRVMATMSAGLTIVALLGVVAFVQRGVAIRESLKTTARQLSASANAALEDDPELSILLALEALERSDRTGEQPPPEALAALYRGITASRLQLRLDDGHRKVAASPDGALLATDSLDRETTRPTNKVLVRDAETGTLLKTLTGEAQVSDLVWSPDGSILAVGYRNWWEEAEGTVALWDPATGRELSHFTGGNPVDWSPDGELLVTAYQGGHEFVIAVRDIMGATLSSLSVSAWGPVGFSDRSTLAVGDPEGNGVNFHDVLTGDVIGRLDTPGFQPRQMAIDQARRRLVLGGDGIQVWDMVSQNLLWSATTEGSIAVNPVTGMVASSGSDGQVRLHDSGDGTILLELTGHTGAVDAVSFYPDGERLASVAVDGETRIWDITPGGSRAPDVISVGSAEPHAVYVSPDGTEVVVGADRSLQRFDFATEDQLPGSLTGQINWWEPASVSPDWRLAAALDSDRRGHIYDLETGRVLSTLGLCEIGRGFSPDGSTLVVDSTLACQEIQPPAGAVLRSRVIETISGRELLDLGNRPLLGASAAVFNPEGVFEAGRFLAINLIDIDIVEIYDMTAGDVIATLEFESDWPLGITFDPTGRYLVGGNQNGRAWVLDLSAVLDGAPIENAYLFDRVVDAGAVVAALNASGVLATTAFNSLRLWDIHTGQLLIDLEVDIETPPFAAFSPDGEDLYYVDAGYVLRRYPLDPDRLVEMAQSRLTRGLTDDECSRYMGAESCFVSEGG